MVVFIFLLWNAIFLFPFHFLSQVKVLLILGHRIQIVLFHYNFLYVCSYDIVYMSLFAFYLNFSWFQWILWLLSHFIALTWCASIGLLSVGEDLHIQQYLVNLYAVLRFTLIVKKSIFGLGFSRPFRYRFCISFKVSPYDKIFWILFHFHLYLYEYLRMKLGGFFHT
jgi:hypothetical protein